MGVMFGMPRMIGRRTDDTILMGSGGWRQKPFYIRYFGRSNMVTRPMLKNAILNLLKRTGIKKKNGKDRNSESEGGEDSDEDNEDDAENEKVQDSEDDEVIEHMIPRVETEQNLEDMLLYAEHTQLVKPLKLPDDRYLPREFEDLEVEHEDLRLTIASKWGELQSRKHDSLPTNVSKLEELLNDIYHKAYPPPQSNSEDQKYSSILEEDVHLSGNSDDTIPSATTPLESEKEIPVDTQEITNEHGNATPTMPVIGSSEENPTQYALEVSQFKIWDRSYLERKVKELQEEKSMPELSHTEKDELQQTAATQVLGNIEIEVGSLRERRDASLEEMLSHMQFTPLVCELPSLKELHSVPMEKLIDLDIHDKGIYTNEYSKYPQAEIMGDPISSLGSLDLEYPSTVSRPTFELGLGLNVENGEEVQQPVIDLGAPDPPQIHLAATSAPNEAPIGIETSNQAQINPLAEKAQINTSPTLNVASAIDLAAPKQAHMNPATEKYELQQPQRRLPIPQKSLVLDVEKGEEALLKKIKSAEKANAYAETLEILAELQKGKEPGVSQTSAEDVVPLAERLEDNMSTKGKEVEPIEKKKASISVKDKEVASREMKKETISSKEKKDTPKITFTPQKPITRSNPQKRVDPDFGSGKGLSGIKRRKTKSKTETPVEQDFPTVKVQKKDDENVKNRKAKGGTNL
ncbi:probable serine/threonine-protein kinase kinX [Papaver somniferum]|uniref:probable serine/threonine-protein kinase kinX n=1 Tax=Papaver somniferum TaxID=3469 RepID=UPI000E703847|nr:probable serine/threonine-protein kinase kinX [Papaver somniferum]